ncbi:oligopeptide:H+ symporter [Acetobacter sp. AN02]|uniref:peptide MFS transporter n=1 Tax=Acetobacter sp. AN02 TaxID=2894186 RepID=UPI0024343FD6|nr:oligopeptide:H+ symporter [Acetobacter sp. AN02]MDG6094876.1 oligopeptide:H+ symporter [Acetobacter sp. AN02]
MSAPPVSRTRSFSVVLAVELWERFGYYGMQGVLLLFLVHALHFPEINATLLMGAFAALTYAIPAAGGWLGDRVTGSRRAVIAGSLTLSFGYALLGLATFVPAMLYAGMGLVAVGNGLFKPNAANLVRRIYDGDDARIDAAFTLYYMAVNVGSMVSLLLTPWLAAHVGWFAPFATCSAGLLSGLASVLLGRRALEHVGSEPDFRPFPVTSVLFTCGGVLVSTALVGIILSSQSLAKAIVWLAGLSVLIGWTAIYLRSDRRARAGLRLVGLLVMETILFFIFYEQTSTSLILFAEHNVRQDFTIAGHTLFSLTAGQLQALNPFWIILASPILARVYARMAAAGRDFSIASKFVAGFGLVTLAFAIWWLSAAWSPEPMISPWVMFWAYGAQSTGELLISALGLAFIARYVDRRIGAFMSGAYFLSVGISMYLGSFVASMAALPAASSTADPAATLPVYADLFRMLTLVGAGGTILFALLLPLARKWDREFQQTGG